MKRFATMCFGLIAVFMLGGCDNLQRSLVFTTGTTLGIEIAATPQSDGQLRFLMGYKRVEILFDPIMDDAETNSDPAKREMYTIKPRAHSVIAKLLGEMKATGKTGAGPEATGGMQVSQWFASGKAAEILAKHGASSVLTDNPIVAQAASDAAVQGSLRSATGEAADVIAFLVEDLYNTLGKMADPNVPPNVDDQLRQEASRLKIRLDQSAIVKGIPATFAIIQTTTLGANKTLIVSLSQYHTGIGFELVTGYHRALRESVEELSELQSWIVANDTIVEKDQAGNTITVNITPARRTQLLETLNTQQSTLESLRKQIVNDPDVIALLRSLAGTK